MQDSLVLFKSISYNSFLSKSSILLFLNKKDIFIDKLPLSPLKGCFPDYTGKKNLLKSLFKMEIIFYNKYVFILGSNVYEEASDYILKQFLKRVPPNKTVYNHFTNATDTKNVEVVFAASMNTILNKALSTIGMSWKQLFIYLKNTRCVQYVCKYFCTKTLNDMKAGIFVFVSFDCIYYKFEFFGVFSVQKVIILFYVYQSLRVQTVTVNMKCKTKFQWRLCVCHIFIEPLILVIITGIWYQCDTIWAQYLPQRNNK